jgi:hypothetical protein
MSYSGQVMAVRREIARKFGLSKLQLSRLTSEEMAQLSACSSDECRRLLLGVSERNPEALAKPLDPLAQAEQAWERHRKHAADHTLLDPQEAYIAGYKAAAKAAAKDAAKDATQV